MTTSALDSYQHAADRALHAPWSIRFERDGTEDIGVISDADGAELFTSRTFWLPQPGDPESLTLAALRAIIVAPQLLAACRMVIDRWEQGDLDEAVDACQAAVKLATDAHTP